MKYSTGQTVLVGDEVFVEHGGTFGHVSRIIETAKQMAQWNVDEPGLMLESEPFGLVFWPIVSSDPVIFVSRKKASAS
jgi:hypothetical protein